MCYESNKSINFLFEQIHEGLTYRGFCRFIKQCVKVYNISQGIAFHCFSEYFDKLKSYM